ncbi:hypothetical protein [Chitinophaga varians]|uniref:hypothetical protein n=1 Tax=Chitinophaga varians TaxID=2202339 RepID=UPI00165FFCF2|nr:hypothetical protein [Chitinophaga varians]MBC9911102.1 hypothetical protein [Chitinophaga varians]
MRYVIYIFMLLLMISCRHRSQSPSVLNKTASVTLPGDLPENPLMLHAITSAIYPKDSITTVLYGNDIAYAHAARKTDGSYPAGTVLYEVAWKQQADEQWFGANVPQLIKQIERVEVVSGDTTCYTLFQGDIPRKAEHQKDDAQRTAFILGRKMLVSP